MGQMLLQIIRVYQDVSRYTTTEMSIISAKILFMNLWKPTGALVSPLGITSHLKDPYQVLKLVFHLLPLAIWMKWQACHRLILV